MARLYYFNRQVPQVHKFVSQVSTGGILVSFLWANFPSTTDTCGFRALQWSKHRSGQTFGSPNKAPRQINLASRNLCGVGATPQGWFAEACSNKRRRSHAPPSGEVHICQRRGSAGSGWRPILLVRLEKLQYRNAGASFGSNKR